MSGKGDMVVKIRKKRESESISDVVKRIRRKSSS